MHAATGWVYHRWSLYRYCKEKIDQSQLQWYLWQFVRAPIHAILHEEDRELFVRIRIRPVFTLVVTYPDLIKWLYCHTMKDYRYWVSGHWRKDKYVLTWSKSTKWYINCQMWILKSSLNLTPAEILGVTHWNRRRNVLTLNWDSISSQIE